MTNPQLFELLKEIDPVDEEKIEVRPVPPELLAAIAEIDREGAHPRRFRRTRFLPAIGVAGIAIAAITVVLPGSPEKASPEAVRALQAVASIAQAQAEPAPSDPVVYSRLFNVYIGTFAHEPPFSVRFPSTVETWVEPDGSGRIRTEDRPIEWPSERDEARWRIAGSPPQSYFDKVAGISDERVGENGFNERMLDAEIPPASQLPTDPDQLVEIFERAAPDGDSFPISVRVFDYAASVLVQAGASSELRAALYEVVAGLEGVQFEGDVEDPLGRTGTAVSIENPTALDAGDGGIRYVLIFDPETSQPLAYRSELLEPPADFIGSSLLSQWVLEESDRVPDTDTRP